MKEIKILLKNKESITNKIKKILLSYTKHNFLVGLSIKELKEFINYGDQFQLIEEDKLKEVTRRKTTILIHLVGSKTHTLKDINNALKNKISNKTKSEIKYVLEIKKDIKEFTIKNILINENNDKLIYKLKSHFKKGIEKKKIRYTPKFDGFFKLNVFQRKNNLIYTLIDYNCPECKTQIKNQKNEDWKEFNKKWKTYFECKNCGKVFFSFTIKKEHFNKEMYKKHLPSAIAERMNDFDAFKTIGWENKTEKEKQASINKFIELFDEETIREILEYTIDRVSTIPNPMNNFCIDTGKLWKKIKNSKKATIKEYDSFNTIKIPKNKFFLILAENTNDKTPELILEKFENIKEWMMGFKETKHEKYKIIIFE